MDRILLILCNGLSCFIISTILFQFMNGKYKRSSKNRYIYIIAETLTVLLIVGINILNIPILNLLAWIMVSDGTLWEVQTALFFRWTCLPDCAVPELAADYRRNNRRLS